MLSAPAKRPLPPPAPSPRIEPRTLFRVAAIHASLLAALVSLGWIFQPKTDDRFLEMIDLGNAGFNPVTDTSEPPLGATPGPASAPPAAPKPQPKTPPAPQPAENKTPEPVPPPKPAETTPKPKPVPVAETPAKPAPAPKTPSVEAPQTQPSPSAPTKPKINVNTALSQKSSGGPAASASPPSTATAKSGGASSEQIRAQLASGLGKVGGSGNPSAGSPSGTKGANTYNTVIRDALYRNWHVPAGPPPPAVVASLRIYADGRIEFRSFASSSGNPEVDESIVTAVKNTGTLPKPPPPGLANPHYDIEVTFKNDM